MAVTTSIPLSGVSTKIALTPDGALAYVTLPNDNAVAVLDLNANLQVKTIMVGDDPEDIAIARNRPLAYVALQGEGVQAVNTRLATSAATVLTSASRPTGVAFSPDGTLVRHQPATANVSVIDVFRHAQVATIPVGELPIGVETTDDGRLVVVSNFSGDSLSVIDTRTNTVIATIPVGAGPNASISFSGYGPLLRSLFSDLSSRFFWHRAGQLRPGSPRAV